MRVLVKTIRKDLIAIAQKLGLQRNYYYQNEALGTGHADYKCAKDSLRWTSSYCL